MCHGGQALQVGPNSTARDKQEHSVTFALLYVCCVLISGATQIIGRHTTCRHLISEWPYVPTHSVREETIRYQLGTCMHVAQSRRDCRSRPLAPCC